MKFTGQYYCLRLIRARVRNLGGCNFKHCSEILKWDPRNQFCLLQIISKWQHFNQILVVHVVMANQVTASDWSRLCICIQMYPLLNRHLRLLLVIPPLTKRYPPLLQTSKGLAIKFQPDGFCEILTLSLSLSLSHVVARVQINTTTTLHLSNIFTWTYSCARHARCMFNYTPYHCQTLSRHKNYVLSFVQCYVYTWAHLTHISVCCFQILITHTLIRQCILVYSVYACKCQRPCSIRFG